MSLQKIGFNLILDQFGFNWISQHVHLTRNKHGLAPFTRTTAPLAVAYHHKILAFFQAQPRSVGRAAIDTFAPAIICHHRFVDLDD